MYAEKSQDGYAGHSVSTNEFPIWGQDWGGNVQFGCAYTARPQSIAGLSDYKHLTRSNEIPRNVRHCNLLFDSFTLSGLFCLGYEAACGFGLVRRLCAGLTGLFALLSWFSARSRFILTEHDG